MLHPSSQSEMGVARRVERLAACVGGTKDVMLGCTGNDLPRVSHGGRGILGRSTEG